MKIALLSWESMHSIMVGGVAVHVSELARSLAKDGNDVHVFTRRGAGQSSDDEVEGVNYHRCPFWGASDIVGEIDSMCRAFVDRFDYVERREGRFDVVHAHDWLTAMSLTWTGKAAERRRVFTFHSTEYGRCGNIHSGGDSRSIRDREWQGAYTADQVIAVSKHLKEEVRDIYHVPEEKMNVVYNGVDVERFDIKVDVGEVKARYGLGPMDPTVLFCGRLAWQKGPDILLEAIPPLVGYYPHAKFLFVGDGDMRRSLEERAKALGVDHACRFLGYRYDQELVEIFRVCDALCVPSRNEPFGIVILEAWSAGKPVVATCNGGPKEFLRHEVDGLTIYDNPDSVGWGIGSLFTDFDRARWMGENGRVKAATEFDWGRIGHQVERIYED